MPVTVVVGGQFGSEGKGKVAYFFTNKMKASIAVRVGGTNSGHTVIDSLGNPVVLRQLPTASIKGDVYCVIGAGSYIEVDVLLDEIKRVKLPHQMLLIDPNAMIITQEDQLEERSLELRSRIGSTLSGTGAAVHRRIARLSSVRLAAYEDRLQEFVRPVLPFLRSRLDAGERIIVEGTQGFGLSLLHSVDYPYVTSRDTTAAAFISEAGLSPLDVDQIVLVLRAFPIRVAGNSGRLPNEIDWETITNESGSPHPIIEYTSVTGMTRRVARFQPEVVRQAILVNQPTHVVMNHLDYIDASCAQSNQLSKKVHSFVRDVESMIGISINYLGFSPSSFVENLQKVEIM